MSSTDVARRAAGRDRAGAIARLPAGPRRGAALVAGERTAQWRVAAAACVLMFAGHLVAGARADAAALAFAALWLALGGGALIAFAREGAPTDSPLLALAALLFVGMLTVVASQLLPAPPGMAHPLWRAVDGAAPLTLDRDATLREIVKLISLAAAFATGFVIGTSDRRTRRFALFTVAASALYAGWAFFERFGGSAPPLAPGQTVDADALTASFRTAGSAATVLGMLAVLATARIARAVKVSGARARKGASRTDQLARGAGLSAVALLLLLTCLAATESRAGLAACLAAVLMLAAWEIRAAASRKSLVRRMTLIAVAAAGLAAFALLAPPEGGGGAEARWTALQAHGRAALEALWRGYGLGGFPRVNALIQTPETHQALASLDSAHNVYLQWVEEAGVLGAAAMFGCIAFLLAHIWRGLSERRRMRTWLRAVLAASLLVLLHGIVNAGLQTPSIAWQWALWLGIGCGLARSHGPEPAEPDEADELAS